MSSTSKSSWTERALEPFFQILDPHVYRENRIFCGKCRVGTSKLVPGQTGVFATTDLKKGECVEWGIASIIPGVDVNTTDKLYCWDPENRFTAATVSGCGLFYNTLGDKSNVRCVPYHDACRFEMYALEDIAAGTELTIRSDSMNWRPAMKDVKSIVGELEKGDH